MDTSEAARALGVADSEIVEVRDVGGRLEVLHHDMASHEETWRPLPELASGGIVTGPPIRIGEQGPEDVVVDEPTIVKPMSKRRGAR